MAVVDEVLVDFVGEEEEVVRAADGGDGFDFGERENLSAGIGGGVEQDGAGARGDGRVEGVGVEGPVWFGEGDEDGLDAHGFESGDVVAVEGLEEQDFVVRIEQGHGGGVESAGGAAGDEDFSLGVVGEAVVFFLLRSDGVAEAGDAVEAGVDVVSRMNGGEGFGFDGRRHGGVADSLGEIDAADAIALGGHGADFRLHGAGRELAEGEAGGGVGMRGSGVGHGEVSESTGPFYMGVERARQLVSESAVRRQRVSGSASRRGAA